MASERKKVVLIAPCCDGTDVGEARSSFQWVVQLSQHYDVTVLSYRKRNRPSLVGQLTGVEIVEWNDLPIFGLWERMNSMLKPGYVLFYFRARKWLRNRLAGGGAIDLIHQIAPLALRYPCPAFGLGIPYIVGPLGGSLSTPAGFGGEGSLFSGYTQLRALDRIRLRHDPVLRRSLAEAEAVIGVAPYVRDLLGAVAIKRFEVASETGVENVPTLDEEGSESTVCKLLFVGRLVRMKGARDVIRALSHIPEDVSLHLDIVGDGEDRTRCEEEAKRLGQSGRVAFHGRVPREQVDWFYREADVFVFPSVREPSGNVVLEAMSFALPLVVADRGGPAFVVDDSCGIRVAVTEPTSFAEGISKAVKRLVADPELRKTLGRGARQRVEDFHTWEKRTEFMQMLYSEILARKPL